MTKEQTRTLLESLHGLLAEEFINRIQSGEAEPALLNAARQFLKDNAVDACPAASTPLAQLSIMLPFTPEVIDVTPIPKTVLTA